MNRRDLLQKTLAGATLAALSCDTSSAHSYKNIDDGLYFGHPESYGAIGDGITDDTNAIQQCINNHAITILSSKIYRCSNIVLDEGRSLWGMGKRNSILVGSNNNEFVLSVLGRTNKGWGGSVRDLCIDGNGAVETAVYLGGGHNTVTKGCFSGIRISGARSMLLVLDAVQNSYFYDLELLDVNTSCNYGLVLINGAGNNEFNCCELAAGLSGSIHFGKDHNFDGHLLNAFNNINTNNLFNKCVIEIVGPSQSIANRKVSISLEFAKLNTFLCCDILASRDASILLAPEAIENKFISCSFGSNYISTVPIVVNHGYMNRFVSCFSENHHPDYHIITSQPIIISDFHVGDGNYALIKNVEGNANNNIRSGGVITYYNKALKGREPHFVFDDKKNVWFSFDDSLILLNNQQCTEIHPDSNKKNYSDNILKFPVNTIVFLSYQFLLNDHEEMITLSTNVYVDNKTEKVFYLPSMLGNPSFLRFDFLQNGTMTVTLDVSKLDIYKIFRTISL